MRRLASLLELPRIPEPETMDDRAEVDAYSSAAAQSYLESIDDTFVEHSMRLLQRAISARRGTALDIGCGPGQIVLKLAQRLPHWRFFAIDRSASMIRQAISAQRRMPPPVATAVEFFIADGNSLPFAGHSFDFVCCNSVLHHLQHPARFLGEIARVAKPGAAILVRDLARPGRLLFPLHVRWYGRHYSGLMYRLYRNSVRAAYTPAELAQLVQSSPLNCARIFTRGRTHLGLERDAR